MLLRLPPVPFQRVPKEDLAHYKEGDVYMDESVDQIM